jgi:hypothetical protein
MPKARHTAATQRWHAAAHRTAPELSVMAAVLQVRVLSGQLRDAQNLLITKDRAAAVAAAAAGLKGGAAAAAGLGDPAAAVAAQRKAAELTRELCRCGASGFVLKVGNVGTDIHRCA